MSAIPPEVLQIIFTEADPASLGTLAVANREFHSIVEGLILIWKVQYLDIFDNPIPALTFDLSHEKEETYDWKGVLRRRVRASAILRDILILKRKPEERVDFYRTLVDIAHTALPASIFAETSKNVEWLRRVYDHELFLHHTQWEPSPEEHQFRSHLHVLLGMTNIDLLAEQRHTSRSYVYDLSHYTHGSMYGPYLESDDVSVPHADPDLRPRDGLRVSWVHMRYVHHVFNFNYLERHLLQLAPFSVRANSTDHKNYPMNIHYIRPDSAPPNTPGIGFTHDIDWAGIEGRWQCGFCFCDHPDLIRFNTFLQYKRRPEASLLDLPPLDPFLAPDFREALRFIEVDLRVLAVGQDSSDYPYPERPPIHFEGRIFLGQDNEDEEAQDIDASIIGTVSMTREKTIRWFFTSGGQGHIVWSSEGVQVGGLRSSYGVLGIWTTVFHDDDDPAGPFWLRKKAGRVR